MVILTLVIIVTMCYQCVTGNITGVYGDYVGMIIIPIVVAEEVVVVLAKVEMITTDAIVINYSVN